MRKKNLKKGHGGSPLVIFYYQKQKKDPQNSSVKNCVNYFFQNTNNPFFLFVPEIIPDKEIDPFAVKDPGSTGPCREPGRVFFFCKSGTAGTEHIIIQDANILAAVVCSPTTRACLCIQ